MGAPGISDANSTSLSSLIDSEVQRILNEGRAIARTILTEHSAQLQHLATELMEREQLDRKQFEALLGPTASA
jgi:ATP-dependent Zn protease